MLEKIPGIGQLAASALVASIADARSFDNGRQVSAWLGLVPLARRTASGPIGRLSRLQSGASIQQSAAHEAVSLIMLRLDESFAATSRYKVHFSSRSAKNISGGQRHHLPVGQEREQRNSLETTRKGHAMTYALHRSTNERSTCNER